jgi:hypothetical protein
MESEVSGRRLTSTLRLSLSKTPVKKSFLIFGGELGEFDSYD